MRRALLAIAFAAGEAAAQARPAATLGAAPRAATPCVVGNCAEAPPPASLGADSADVARRAPVFAVVASAAIPGSGQALLRSDRFLPYLAFEVFAWTQYASHAREAGRKRDAYRQLASSVARSRFSDTRPVGNFEYYERMEHYQESGAFDTQPGGGIDPESDTLTFNGAMWLLARRTYWKDVNQE